MVAETTPSEKRRETMPHHIELALQTSQVLLENLRLYNLMI